MKVKTKLPITLVLGILIIPCFIAAQEKSQNVLTLERIYKTNEFQQNEFGPARWLEDGSGYTTLEASQKFANVKNIIKYTPKTGERVILVNASQLIPKGRRNPLLIKNYN